VGVRPFFTSSCGIEFVVVERRTAGFPFFSASGGHAIVSALGDQAALELCDGSEDMEH
jgi:hypothetical protein